MTELKPYQQRVIAERDELRARLARLEKFLEGESVKQDVGAPEWARLQRQASVMHSYVQVLDDRVEAFGRGLSLGELRLALSGHRGLPVAVALPGGYLQIRGVEIRDDVALLVLGEAK